MLIAWLSVAAMNGALLYYVQKPVGRSEIFGYAVVALGWPFVVPAGVIYAAVDTLRGK